MSGPIDVDSESGGAYSHYPFCKTPARRRGSGEHQKNFAEGRGKIHDPRVNRPTQSCPRTAIAISKAPVMSS